MHAMEGVRECFAHVRYCMHLHLVLDPSPRERVVRLPHMLQANDK